MRIKYENIGRQEPIFFGENCGEIIFAIKGTPDADIAIEYSFDPVRVSNHERIWDEFVGGLGGGFLEPPTAIRLNIKQASEPVLFWVNQEKGDKNGSR